MSINTYIDSLTQVDKNKSVENVTWSRVVAQENKRSQLRSSRGKGVIPYQFDLQKADQTISHQKDQKYHTGKKTNLYERHHDSKENCCQHRFADIVSSVREVGAGYNTFSNNAIERRFKENKAKYVSTEESDSNTTYATVNLESTEESFKTAVTNLSTLKLSCDESKDAVLVDDINEERYKKNALITGLLQTQYNDSFNTNTSTEHSSLCNKSQDIENVEDWDKEDDDESMYKGRIIRFFQSSEDKDVLLHPLLEQIQKDSEWQSYQLPRKAVEIIQTPRQYYLDLGDESFNFQPRNSE